MRRWQVKYTVANPSAMTLSTKARNLAIGLVLAIVLELMLTPLGGLEPRSVANTTTIGLVTIVLFLAGVVLQLAALGMLFRRPRTAPVLALIGLVLYFPIFIADITGLWSSQPAPPAITYLSIITAMVVVGVLLLCREVSQEHAAVAPAGA